MVLHKEQERLCRELGNKEGLALSLFYQAFLLADEMNCPREALLLVEEAYYLASDHGLSAFAEKIGSFRDSLKVRVTNTPTTQ
jgi:hypothetical protein